MLGVYKFPYIIIEFITFARHLLLIETRGFNQIYTRFLIMALLPSESVLCHIDQCLQLARLKQLYHVCQVEITEKVSYTENFRCHLTSIVLFSVEPGSTANKTGCS
jgi:hypothetical protein